MILVALYLSKKKVVYKSQAGEKSQSKSTRSQAGERNAEENFTRERQEAISETRN